MTWLKNKHFTLRQTRNIFGLAHKEHDGKWGQDGDGCHRDLAPLSRICGLLQKDGTKAQHFPGDLIPLLSEQGHLSYSQAFKYLQKMSEEQADNCEKRAGFKGC